MMNKKKIITTAKCAFKLVATIGTAIIVKSLLDAVTPKHAHPAKKIAVVVGGYVISDMIVEKIGEEAEKSWDRITVSIKEITSSFSQEKHVS